MVVAPSSEPLGFDHSLPAEQQRLMATVVQSTHQHTLHQRFTLHGVGLHSGNPVEVTVHPAQADTGRRFRRIDVSIQTEIPAQGNWVSQTRLSTELAVEGASVKTVEHLLAALCGLGIDNALIELNSPELPLLDGSAWGWVEAILSVGWRKQDSLRSPIQLQEPCWVRQDDSFVVAFPAAETRLTYGITFDATAIGEQWQSMVLTDFAQEIAPARTFGLLSEVEWLRTQGLIKGGSLENALVCSGEGWLNPPLRYENEPVRHKLLDLLGDLSLLGCLPTAHVVAYKASHTLHTRLVEQLSKRL